MDKEDNKYHFAREIIFNLRTCHAINHFVYLHWIDKLNKDEKENDNLENDTNELTSTEKIPYCLKCDGKGWHYVNEWFCTMQGRKDCECKNKITKQI